MDVWQIQPAISRKTRQPGWVDEMMDGVVAPTIEVLEIHKKPKKHLLKSTQI
jgi:hypothetical protein